MFPRAPKARAKNLDIFNPRNEKMHFFPCELSKIGRIPTSSDQKCNFRPLSLPLVENSAKMGAARPTHLVRPSDLHSAEITATHFGGGVGWGAERTVLYM